MGFVRRHTGLNKLKVNLCHGEGIDIRLRVTVKEIQVCWVDIIRCAFIIAEILCQTVLKQYKTLFLKVIICGAVSKLGLRLALSF